MSALEMSAEAFERLFTDAHRALVAAATAEDDAEVLQLVDEWLARWRDVQPIPHARKVVFLATYGALWAKSPATALAYANEVAALAKRTDDPNASQVVGWVVQLYANVTEITERIEHTLEAADAARRFARRVDPPHAKIDAHLARALRNVAVDADSLDTRLALVEELRQLSARHADLTLEIDEHLAAALVCLSRSLGRGTTEHLELVDELEDLHDKWPLCVEIARVYVAETWNAYTTGGLDIEPEELLARIESVRDALPESHADIEDALARLRAELERE